LFFYLQKQQIAYCYKPVWVHPPINLQVAVGGKNMLNSTLNMTYENFLQPVNLAEQLTSSDFGVSTGLISQGYW
jgi:hypothetical protein